MATLAHRLLFFRLIALLIAVLGTVYLVPTSWIAFIYALAGAAEAFAHLFNGRLGAGLLQMAAAALYGLAELLALYLCYGFFRYAVQASYAWRSRFLWVLACSLSGILALVVAALSASSRYLFGFWDAGGFWAATWILGFSLLTGACWWWSPRA